MMRLICFLLGHATRYMALYCNTSNQVWGCHRCGRYVEIREHE